MPTASNLLKGYILCCGRTLELRAGGFWNDKVWKHSLFKYIHCVYSLSSSALKNIFAFAVTYFANPWIESQGLFVPPFLSGLILMVDYFQVFSRRSAQSEESTSSCVSWLSPCISMGSVRGVGSTAHLGCLHNRLLNGLRGTRMVFDNKTIQFHLSEVPCKPKSHFLLFHVL